MMTSSLRFEGEFSLVLMRKGIIIEFHNAIITEGVNLLFDTMFKSATQTNWYCGLMVGTPVISTADTMASHAGWTEMNDYIEATRPQWVAEDAADRAMTNTLTNAMEFTVNNSDGVSITGGFICNDETKNGTAGKLWCAGKLTTAVSFDNADVIKVIYKIKAY